jgi:hypothetical protein
MDQRATRNAAIANDELNVVAEHDADDHLYAGQILDGAKAIRQYLIYLGFEMTEKRVFHWASNGRLPVKRIGSPLVTSKRALLRHFNL